MGSSVARARPNVSRVARETRATGVLQGIAKDLVRQQDQSLQVIRQQATSQALSCVTRQQLDEHEAAIVAGTSMMVRQLERGSDPLTKRDLLQILFKLRSGEVSQQFVHTQLAREHTVGELRVMIRGIIYRLGPQLATKDGKLKT